MSEVFLDTAYAIALVVEADQHHAAAVRLSLKIEAEKRRLLTTRAILLEIGNSLARIGHRSSAIEILDALESDSMVEIVSLTEDLYRRGYDLFQTRRDKEWGITDCISFVVMQERGVTEALTTDAHFQQAGFVAMLRHPY